MYSSIRKNKDLNSIISVFNNPLASHEEIAEKGIESFLSIYGVPQKSITLNKHQFNMFTKCGTKNKINLASLPPTEEAVKQHSFRVYFQVQLWLRK